METEVKFYLKDINAVEDTLIFMFVRCRDGRLKYSTEIKVLPEKWNKTNYRIIEEKKDREIKLNNQELTRLENLSINYNEKCRTQNLPFLKSDLKKYLDENSHRQKKRNKTVKNFFDSIDLILKEMAENKLQTNRGTYYNAKSIENLKRTKERLKEFDPNMTFENITLERYYSFVSFLNQKGYAINYVGKHIKDWKTLMNIAQNNKRWHNNNIYKHPEFKKPKEKSDKISLSDSDIKKIKEVDLSNYPKNFEVIRDRFIINLFTGYRISDMKKFTEANIDNEVIIQINKKTGKKTAMPVHHEIKDIIKKYDGKLPKQYNDVTVNKIIKIIAKIAELTETIRYTKTEGGKKKEFINEKWELITNHTCRRTFTTSLLKSVDIISAMHITGMSLKTLELYNKRTPEENAEMMKENSFFK